MEAKSAELLAAFKNPNLSVDAKVAYLSSVKSDIKQKNVPEGAIRSIFETLRLAIGSQHYSVLGAGFSTLGHFLKRLIIQDQQQWIVNQAQNLYPTLLERLNDQKERIRAQAASIFTELWPFAGNEVEYYVLEVALVGKNHRSKEMSMLWLANMTKNHGLLFRQYVPSLVACLEDADSAVRDTAKLVVIDLFRTGPARAKSDLQKQMAARGVRKSIANAILSGIGIGSVEPETAPSTRPISRAERPISVMSSRSHAMEHHEDDFEPVKSRPASRAHRERPITSTPAEAPIIHRPQTPAAEKHTPQPPPEDDDGLEPYDLASSRDMDDLVRDMLPWFDGKESEDNWSKREKNAILWRRVTRGNAPHDFSQAFLAATKTLLDGIFKVVNSLRTTMSTNGSLLIQDIARTCGPKIDSMVEIIMQNLMKLCSGLKKIAAQNGNATVDAVIGNVSFSIRLLQHVAFAAQDKNVGVRLFATGWLKTLILRQAHHKSTVEHGGGLDLVEKSIVKGLGDANPGVREASRGTFWTFFGVWPDRANAIADTLDAKSRNLLEKDSSNPNAVLKSSSALPAKSPAKSRSALQEAIAARKKAQMPSRPESAQPAFSEAKTPAPAPKATRTVPTGAPLSSLSSAPMRPGMKPRRAELSRPATADPYARRPESRTQTTREATTSPRAVRSKTSTPTSKPPPAPRNRPNESTQAATTKGRPKKLDLSKSKSHHDLGAANRLRSDSAESQTNYSSVRTPRHGSGLSPTAIRHSPAPVMLESPPLVASQPLLHSAPDGPHAGSVPLEESEPEPMVLEDPIQESIEAPAAAESPQQVVPEAVIEVHHSPERSGMIPVPASESASRNQPEPMVIYEDPATPTTAEHEDHEDHEDHSFAASVGMVSPKTPSKTPSKTPAKSPSKSPFKSPGRFGQINYAEAEAEPVSREPTTPAFASARKPIPDLPPNQEAIMNHGLRTPSPTRRTPLQPSPSPTRGRAPPAASNVLPDMDITVPHEPSMDFADDHGNNENATPRLSKTVDTPSIPRSAAKPTALEEVTANESVRRSPEARQQLSESFSQSTLSQSALSQSALSQSTMSEDSSRRTRKWVDRHRSPSPRSKDPVNAKEMIHKGLARIQSKTMEPSGYRKLQGLFQYHGEEIVAQNEDYSAMLEALLTELEAAPQNRKDHDVKTQVLATIRSMLLRTREHFSPYDTRAMAAIIRARQHYESSSHFVVGLEEAVDKLVFLTTAQTAIAGVLQALDLGDEGETDETYRSTIMGLSTIQQSLTRPGTEISDELLASIGAVVMQKLSHPRPGVRKNATELCTFLNITFGSERVQKVTQPPREGSLNLLTYFMARRTQ
ncbi:HEAT type 2 [Penicillium brevicompactum]|uniref:HEAT type 2 n=1 Tax=Penicillium brevicompactum TaxID=5074 RepID=UPI00253F7EE8|nr:HEAT type 2 [Penicillium brevicompactum]KAJ5332424.1 HEAT type 2 [Penicillium brevicompactum]